MNSKLHENRIFLRRKWKILKKYFLIFKAEYIHWHYP